MKEFHLSQAELESRLDLKPLDAFLAQRRCAGRVMCTEWTSRGCLGSFSRLGWIILARVFGLSFTSAMKSLEISPTLASTSRLGIKQRCMASVDSATRQTQDAAQLCVAGLASADIATSATSAAYSAFLTVLTTDLLAFATPTFSPRPRIPVDTPVQPPLSRQGEAGRRPSSIQPQPFSNHLGSSSTREWRRGTRAGPGPARTGMQGGCGRGERAEWGGQGTGIPANEGGGR
jgi:hypothetical protein